MCVRRRLRAEPSGSFGLKTSALKTTARTASFANGIDHPEHIFYMVCVVVNVEGLYDAQDPLKHLAGEILQKSRSRVSLEEG